VRSQARNDGPISSCEEETHVAQSVLHGLAGVAPDGAAAARSPGEEGVARSRAQKDRDGEKRPPSAAGGAPVRYLI
jgi:hypothetical protein